MENAGEESSLSSTGQGGGDTESIDVVAKLQNYVNTWSMI